MEAIRRAKAEDAAAVRGVVEAAFAAYVPVIGRRPAPMEADYAALIAAGSVWLCETGVLVGYRHGPDWMVETVAVAPEAAGSGTGRHLMAFAEARAQEAGAVRIVLYTNAAMAVPLAWYKRLGFIETGRSTASGFARVHFAKAL